MKKLVALSAFIVFGFASAYAQSPSKKATAPAATIAPASMQVTAPVIAESVVSDQAVVAETKKETKKECSTDEKKACGTKSGKKSCCSDGAKKEEGK